MGNAFFGATPRRRKEVRPDLKPWMELAKGLVWFTQLGVSLVVPVLLFVGGAAWLQLRLGAPGWIMAPAFLLGLGTAGATARRFYRDACRKAGKRRKDAPVGFNRHL